MYKIPIQFSPQWHPITQPASVTYKFSILSETFEINDLTQDDNTSEKEFETKFAKYLDVKYALSTNSGSSANLLALSALTSHKLGEKRLKKGDEVISVAAGFPTTINPIIQQGLVPVFVDCEVGTYNIDAEKIEEALRELMPEGIELRNCRRLEKGGKGGGRKEC